MVTLAALLIMVVNAPRSSAFFFTMPTIRMEHYMDHPTTEATTTKTSSENKPIHIHHHYEVKYIHVPETTTKNPWTWAPWPSYHTQPPEVWEQTKWNVKPVIEPVYEDHPENPWKPYWDWQTTTTEAPYKWAYKRQISVDGRSIKSTTMAPIVVTPSLEVPSKRKITKRILNETKIPEVIKNVREVTTKPNVVKESNTKIKPENLLYKYIYKVHSPHTKDIKMHHEQSDGQQITGHYSFVEPNGSTRVVYYTAGKEGFNAQVKHFNWSTNSTHESNEK